MLIEIHMIQNHSPANLNRDDMGAPKTCFFGGVLRSRISSQCIKRSIRRGPEFRRLLGGIRTRQLSRLIAKEVGGKADVQRRAEKILELCGFKPKKSKQTEDGVQDDRSKMAIYTTPDAIREMGKLLQEQGKSDDALAREFAKLIAERTAVPDMALSGRMLEPDESAKKVWDELETRVEAALQVAHAISTHTAHPEVDYYVAADDIPGQDAGAAYVDEAMFASACFYKYFSVNWEKLVENLAGFQGNKEHLAAHTVGAFLRGAALVNPTGKQNSFAAHNLPDGILVEVRESPISYSNAFANPVPATCERGLIGQSIAQLAQYVRDLDVGYPGRQRRFWYSPNLRHALSVVEDKKDIALTDNNHKSLDDLIHAVLREIGFDWQAVQTVILPESEAAWGLMVKEAGQ
jgi:CRISPR system Cascade subunit CasC